MISMAASARIVDPAESEDHVGVQDAAERLADGRRDRRAHEGERREDDGLHRLRRRLRRQLAGRDEALGADRRHQDRRRGEIQPQRPVGHRPGAEAGRRQSRRDPDRRVPARPARRRRRSWSRAATRARSTRRTASPIPTSCASSARTATARSCRPARCWSTSSCPTPIPVKKSAAEYVTTYEGEIRHGSRDDVRRPRVGRVPAAAARDSRGAEEGEARHEGIPRGVARCARERQGRRRQHGVFNMSAADHNGLDNRARVMVKIENGKWVLSK